MKKTISKPSKLKIQVLPDDYLSPEDCYQISHPKAKLPKDLTIIFAKDTVRDAIKAFQQNKYLQYKKFEAEVVSNTFRGTLVGTHVVFRKFDNSIITYARFLVKETGIRYKIEFTVARHITRLTAKKMSINWSYPDSDDLFEGRFSKGFLRINKCHLKAKDLEKLSSIVEAYNLAEPEESDIVLFKISPTSQDMKLDSKGGLGVLLSDVPWSDKLKRFGYENQPQRIKERLQQNPNLPKAFVNLIWQAGYAGVEVVIFDAQGSVFEILPKYSHR